MRILHISSQQPDQTGSGIYIQEIMAQAQLCGHENALVASLPQNGLPPENLACSQSFFLYFETESLPFPIPGMSDIMPYKSTIFNAIDDKRLKLYLRQLQEHLQHAIHQFKPDIIHSNHLWIISALTRRVAPHIPLVVSCHGSDIRQFTNCSHLRSHVLAGCQKIDYVLALTEDQKESISSLYHIDEKKIEVVGSGVKASLFTPPRSPRSSKKLLKVLYAGKLSKPKGVPYLLKALKGLEDEVHLVIAGDGVGDEAELCHKLIDEMTHHVEYIGKVSQTQLARKMQDCDIFILPSLFEGMPLVVLEAMSCGCQVLATALPGVLEIADKTSSPALHLITMPQVYDVDQLTHKQELKFIEYIRNALQQLALHIRKNEHSTTSIDYFHWSKVFERINKVYSQLE